MQAARALVTVLGDLWIRTAYPLQAACIVLPAILFVGLARVDYQIERDHVQEDVATTSAALAEHAQTVVQTADLVLGRVLEHIGTMDWRDLADTRATHDFLVHLQRQLPQVEAVYLIDPNGILAASSRAWPMPRYDVRDTPYFMAAKARDDNRAVISPPFPDTKSGTNGFMISRRRMRGDVFDGVVAVTLSQRYFETFYRTILPHPGESSAGLVRTDGTVLVRFPGPAADRPVMLPPSNPVLVAAHEGRESGVFAGRSDIDGIDRIGGFRRLHDLPLLAGYAVNRSVFLATWILHAAVIGVCAILLSILLLATEYLVRRKTAIEHDTLRRLVEETERRRQAEAMAQQSQKMEALGRLTGGVAHDFNNLLAVILGAIELAQKHVGDARSARMLRTATQAAQRGAKLTAQMLAFSRKHEIAIEPVDVNSVIRGMNELLRRTLGPAVRLRHDLAGQLGAARADKAQLELALLNLALNARDAMPDGGELTFRTRALSQYSRDGLTAGDYVSVQVSDTGAGMTNEVLSRAHEPFFTTKGPGHGTGLGLSMVYGLAKELGGIMTIDSTVGAGTTVTLYLRGSNSVPVRSAPKAEGHATPPVPGRILLVDDDDDVRCSIQALLEDQGHAVVAAAGGPEALDVLGRDRRFDVLIFDFAMPRMNGCQLAQEVVKSWPSAPVMFVSGYAENDALRPWSDRGYETVRKPFNTRDLGAAIERTKRREQTAGADV
jgi:two-component system NtrC family sensor kinase